MAQPPRSRPTSVNNASQLLGRSSSASPPNNADLSSFSAVDAAAFQHDLNSLLASSTTAGAYDPTFAADLSQQGQYSLGNGYPNFQQQGQSQTSGLVDNSFAQLQGLQTGANGESSAFPSFDITQAGFDNSALDPNLLSELDANTLDVLSSHSSPDPLVNGGLVNGNYNMATAALSPTNAHTPPHLLQVDAARRQSASPSPSASPTFQNSNFPMTRPRGVSESLDPSSAMYPVHGHNDWAGVNMGPYQHRRMPSDNISDVSSNHNSPYIGTLDNFDASNAQSSPLLNSNDPTFQDALGLGTFSLADPFPQQTFHTPGHSPGHSPLLMPTEQRELPLFTADNNYGLTTNLNGSFNPQPNGLEIFPGVASEPFPALNSTTSPGGMSDVVSPPEIHVELAPSQQNPVPPTLKTENSDDALMPPSRTNRARAKSVNDAERRSQGLSLSGARPRSPSLQPSNSQTRPTARSLSRGRDPSPGSRHRRAHSGASDQRDYILDLANPDRGTSSNDGSSPGGTSGGGLGNGARRAQKHPALYQCSLCPKRFTRAYNLRSHLRTHTDERPFVCTVCGKAFARQHDRKRHEGLHSGEKKFVCRGNLLSSSGDTAAPAQWGCGRRFARADALGRHFRSEAGRICIKPLLDEEAAERARARFVAEQVEQHQQQQQQVQFNNLMPPNMAVGGAGLDAFFLPQAVLQQYPALANLDWATIAASGAVGGGEDDYGGRSSYDASSGGEYMDDLSEGEMDYLDPIQQQQQQQQGMMGMNGMGRGATTTTTGDYLADFEGR